MTIAAVTLDIGNTVEELRKPCAEAYALWMTTFATGWSAIGLPRQDARELASHVLSLEAAILLSRPAKSVAPIEQAAKFVLQIVRAKVPKR